MMKERYMAATSIREEIERLLYGPMPDVDWVALCEHLERRDVEFNPSGEFVKRFVQHAVNEYKKLKSL
jgi:hypothetical protein